MPTTLRFVQPALVLPEKTIIVGSSPNLLGRGRGSVIDSFDAVVRFNRAPTKGHENDVGSKTTIRVANSHVVLGISMDEGWDPLGQPVDFIQELRDTCLVCWGYLAGFELGSRVHHSVSLHMTEMVDRAFPGKLKGRQPASRFSVGFGFVRICVDSGMVPHVCGFAIEDTDSRGHYWEKVGPDGGCHDRSAEKHALARLRDEGKIIVLP